MLKKYQIENKERNNAIMKFYKMKCTFRAIGSIFHISHSRVHQIVARELKRKKALDR